MTIKNFVYCENSKVLFLVLPMLPKQSNLNDPWKYQAIKRRPIL